MDKLKPCPFCGSNRKPQYIPATVCGVPIFHKFYCNDCGYQTGRYSNKSDAISAWNRRSGGDSRD